MAACFAAFFGLWSLHGQAGGRFQHRGRSKKAQKSRAREHVRRELCVDGTEERDFPQVRAREVFRKCARSGRSRNADVGVVITAPRGSRRGRRCGRRFGRFGRCFDLGRRCAGRSLAAATSRTLRFLWRSCRSSLLEDVCVCVCGGGRDGHAERVGSGGSIISGSNSGMPREATGNQPLADLQLHENALKLRSRGRDRICSPAAVKARGRGCDKRKWLTLATFASGAGLHSSHSGPHPGCVDQRSARRTAAATRIEVHDAKPRCRANVCAEQKKPRDAPPHRQRSAK